MSKGTHSTPVVVRHRMADGSILSDDELEHYQFDVDKVPFVVLQIVADMLKPKCKPPTNQEEAL